MVTRIAALLLLLALGGNAQTDSVYFGSDSASRPAPRKSLSEQPWVDNLTFGGNFQAWFGNPSFVFISPTLGYMAARNLNVGIGGIYNYTSVNYGAYGKFSQSIFGGHTYVRYIIAQSYFVQFQYDMLNQPNWLTPDYNDKVWVRYPLIGGGFRQMVGDKAAIITSIMYNLKPHPLSIYPGRVILQFGFTAGF